MRPQSFYLIRALLPAFSILAVFTFASSTIATAQSTSPEALYDRAIDAITGVGSAHDETEGIDYFRRSAEVGYAPGQIALGYYYETGTVLAKDPAKAVELYKKAALVGDPLAAWLAGRMYYLGNDGLPKDLDAAQKWLKMSAGQNNAYGAYFMARVMADRDAAKATALYKTAAEQGLPQAQYHYGKALKEGTGVAKDLLNAYTWLQVAADAGNSAAGLELANFGDAFGVDQIMSAKTKARDMEQVVVRAASSRGCAGWEGEFAEVPTPPPPMLQRFCH